MAVKKIKYLNKPKGEHAYFEIVNFKQFFATRPKKLLETDYRLDFWAMLYIIKGTGSHYIDYKKYTYRSGNLIMIPKNHINAFNVNDDAQGYIIHIDEPFFIEHGKLRDMEILSFFETPFNDPIMNVDVSMNNTSRILIDLIYKEYLISETNTSQKLIKSLFHSFVYSIRNEYHSEIRKFSASSYKNFYEYRELVEQNYQEMKSVSEYARLMGLSNKTINKACRDCVDVSAKEMITNRLILEIKRLLAQNELKNYEISDLINFDEPANLAGFFKRYTGMSMREFRCQLREE